MFTKGLSKNYVAKNVGMKSTSFSRWLRSFFLVNRVERQKLNRGFLRCSTRFTRKKCLSQCGETCRLHSNIFCSQKNIKKTDVFFNVKKKERTDCQQRQQQESSKGLSKNYVAKNLGMKFPFVPALAKTLFSNARNSTKRQLCCCLVEFLVFNSIH